MNYKIEHIIKACELSGLEKEQTDLLCKNLDEAVRICEDINANSLHELFVLFCIKNNFTEEEIKSKRKDLNLVKLRKKFSILAKEKFPKCTVEEIAEEINRDNATIFYYFKLEKLRVKKLYNLERMRNGI